MTEHRKTKSGFDVYVTRNSIGDDYSIDIQKNGMSRSDALKTANRIIEFLDLQA